MFKSAATKAFSEIERRGSVLGSVMKFGIEFLDDALGGIFPDDLVLIGAPSGVGKTGLCCNIALANVMAGKRVHYIALEAAEDEIERRIKYPMVMKKFYADHSRPNLKINFSDWMMGKYLGELAQHEVDAAKEFEEKYQGLFLFYKQENFGLPELITSVAYASSDTDLIIIDHVHYFDFDDDNENRAIKKIAKTVRHLALDEGKPIILISHLRKRDRGNDELIAGLDEFMGTSDLYKVATRVITMAPGDYRQEDGNYDTYFRIPKNRWNGGVTRFSAKEIYDPRIGGYKSGAYEIGKSNQFRAKGFIALDHWEYPEWARQTNPGSSGSGANASGQSGVSSEGAPKVLQNFAEKIPRFNQGNSLGGNTISSPTGLWYQEMDRRNE